MHTPSEDTRYLDRLKNGNQPQKISQKEVRVNKIRNYLNITFILLAVVAMFCIGIALYQKNNTLHTFGIYVGIVAVIIKMGEATLRMSTFTKTKRDYRPSRFLEKD